MSLDLSLEVETQVLERAQAAGTTASDYIARLLRDTPPPDRNVAVSAEDPVLAFLNAHLQEAENATPEEVAQAEQEWRQFKQSMNETRLANGERLLFPENARETACR